MKRLQAHEPGQQVGRFDEAWGGIASLSTALPVMWTECARRGFDLNHLAQWLSAAPARLAGLSDRVGSIEPGKDANLVAFNPEAEWVLESGHLHYRHAISPYLGEALRGKVQRTWLRGEAIFQDGQFTDDEPRGREYTVSCSLP